MKITLEIPDTTVAAFFDFVYTDGRQYLMQGHSITTDELQSGKTIIIEKGDLKDDCKGGDE